MRICPACRLRYHDDSTECLVDGATLEPITDERVGSIVGGRYAIEGELGSGGMATVYQARHTLTDEQVAVKILHPHVAADEGLCERLRREARAAAAIAHENVVRIFDQGETDDGAPYLAMELLDGPSLHDLIQEGPLELGRVVSLGTQIATGLARGHDLDVIHRDLKPANVIVVRSEAGREVAKIVDFGLARRSTEERLTVAGTVVGTPQYMAPERLRGQPARPAADLYALGVVLFEMVTGRPPFDADSPMAFALCHLERPPHRARELAPGCPASLDQLIADLLNKDPARRPVDAHEVTRRLSAVQAPASRPPADWRTTTLGTRSTILTLERWRDRLEAFEEGLAAAYPEGAPEALRVDLESLRAKVDELGVARAEALGAQGRLGRLERELQEGRGRIGHAVHVLALDLSAARARRRRAEERLEAARERQQAERTDWLAHDGALEPLRSGERSPRREDIDRARSAAAALGAWQATEEAAQLLVADVERARSEEEDLGYQTEALRRRLAQDEARFDAESRQHQEVIDASGKVRARLTPELLALVARLSRPLADRPDLAERAAEPRR